MEKWKVQPKPNEEGPNKLAPYGDQVLNGGIRMFVEFKMRICEWKRDFFGI